MRTIGIVIVAIVIVGLIACWAIPGLSSHGKQWREDAATAIDKSSSDEHIIGIYDNALSETGKKLREFYRAIYGVKTEIAQIDAAKTAQEEQLAKEEQVLKRAKEVLEQSQPESTIKIGGATYTWQQVNDDVIKHVGTCRVLRRGILDKEQSLSKLNKAYNDGLNRIQEARAQLVKEKLEKEAKTAELAALRAQERINEITGKIYTNLDVETDLIRARKVFETRLNDLRANAEYNQEVAPGNDIVQTWNAELGIPSEKAVDSINNYFHKEEGKPTKAATSAPTQPAVVAPLDSLGS